MKLATRVDAHGILVLAKIASESNCQGVEALEAAEAVRYCVAPHLGELAAVQDEFEGWIAEGKTGPLCNGWESAVHTFCERVSCAVEVTPAQARWIASELDRTSVKAAWATPHLRLLRQFRDIAGFREP